MNIQDLPKPLQILFEVSKTKRIKFKFAKNENSFTPNTVSKVGGVGYLPQGESYPTQKNGKPLVLLAQLNFKQISEAVDISQLPHPLPKQGILQIYIAVDADDGIYGCDFDNYLPHDKYQVRFWQDDSLPINTEALTKAIQTLNAMDTDGLPFNYDYEYDMRFELTTQSCGYTSWEYKRFLESTSELPKLNGMAIWEYWSKVVGVEDEALSEYEKLAGSQTHQLLGYPNFTQTDPREWHKELQEHILLLQIETDDSIDDRGYGDIMWGDCGVANFFIHPVDLKNQDFSKLLYNWDCC
ncbi:MAG: DUF1963 domain-containing protein [Moraxella sp.]|nr:DUF1963 domain-containing protein [Moraxella sp.]